MDSPVHASSTISRINNKSNKRRQEERMYSPIYTTEDIVSINFKIHMSDEGFEYLSTQTKVNRPHSHIFKEEGTGALLVDIGYNKSDRELMMSYLNSDIFTNTLSKYLLKLKEDHGGEIGLTPIFNIHPDMILMNAEERKQYRKNKEQRRQNGKKFQLEMNIRRELNSDHYKSYKQIAKEQKTSIYQVRKLWMDMLAKIKQEDPAPPRDNRRILVFPPRKDVMNFFKQYYVREGHLGISWNELTEKFCKEFDIKGYTLKSIAKKLKKSYGVKSYRTRRRQSKVPPEEFLKRQLSVSLVVSAMLASGEAILFFDQSSIDINSFKKSALGTKLLFPTINPLTKTQSIFFLTAISHDGFTAIQFSNQSARGSDVLRFIDHVIHKFNRVTEDGKSIYIVLDNAGYQKTAEFKRIPEAKGVGLLYNIPNAPYNNIVEDFFLKLKQKFRSSHPVPYHQALNLLTESLISTVREGYDWIVRKFVLQVQKRLLAFTLLNQTKPPEYIDNFIGKKRDLSDMFSGNNMTTDYKDELDNIRSRELEEFKLKKYDDIKKRLGFDDILEPVNLHNNQPVNRPEIKEHMNEIIDEEKISENGGREEGSEESEDWSGD